jgi:hypothetical protein
VPFARKMPEFAVPWASGSRPWDGTHYRSVNKTYLVSFFNR